MLRLSRCLRRYHTLHPKASLKAQLERLTALRESVSASQRTLRRPLILEDLDAPVQPITAPASASSVTARQLWNASVVARGDRSLRRARGTCIVGGAKSIRRIWRDYKVAPLVVYVPNTEPVLPPWCLEEEQPTYLVPCSPVSVKKQLLSAEYSDGYAAEFPWHSAVHSPPLATLFPPTAADGMDVGGGHRDRDAATTIPAVRALVVLVGLRIPSNVGLLIRAAVDMGYAHVLLVNCVDAFHEKVVRASEGTAYAPHVSIYELPDSVSCVPLLSSLAQQHRLLPLLAVPSQEAEPAFNVAKRFHAHNITRSTPTSTSLPLGPMVVLGSEAHGLHELDGEWNTPYQVITLPLPNALVDSYNVTVAGSILLNLFQPAAQQHFADVMARNGETPEDHLLETLTDNGPASLNEANGIGPSFLTAQ